jgi:hypothetical protein
MTEGRWSAEPMEGRGTAELTAGRLVGQAVARGVGPARMQGPSTPTRRWGTPAGAQSRARVAWSALSTPASTRRFATTLVFRTEGARSPGPAVTPGIAPSTFATERFTVIRRRECWGCPVGLRMVQAPAPAFRNTPRATQRPPRASVFGPAVLETWNHADSRRVARSCAVSGSSASVYLTAIGVLPSETEAA